MMPFDASTPPPTSTLDQVKSGPQLRPHEFFVIRYFPSVIRGEFINIGAVVREVHSEGDTGPRKSAVRLTRDWRRVYALSPYADLDGLERMEDQFEEWLRDTVTGTQNPWSEFDAKCEQLSLSVQLTDPEGCMAADIDTHLDLLMKTFVTVPHSPELLGRVAILNALRSSLDEAQVLKDMSRIHSSKYVGAGDTLEYDFYYRTKKVAHIIHAIAIEEGVDEALALTQRMEKLRRGVLRVEERPLTVTVVVEDPGYLPKGSEGAEQYRFAVKTMRDAGINVVPVNELRALITTIKRSLSITKSDL